MYRRPRGRFRKNLRSGWWKLRSRCGGLRNRGWAIRIRKARGGEIQTGQIAQLGRRRGKSTRYAEPWLGLLGRMRRHENNLHEIVGTGRFSTGFGAHLQFYDGRRAREL